VAPEVQGQVTIGDLIAAMTVWALPIPESMAYASVAGIPVQYGLYAATFAGFAYMIFGASRRFFGPDSAPAAVSAGVVAGVVGANATPDHHIAATAALTLLVGVIFIVLGLLGLDWVSKFFAQPALTGFVFGLGWFIAVGQLPKLVGIHKPSGDTVKILFDTVIHIGDWNWYAVGVGRVALAALFAASRFVPPRSRRHRRHDPRHHRRQAFNLHKVHGVHVVGEVPGGFHFAPWSSISLHDVYSLIPGRLRADAGRVFPIRRAGQDLRGRVPRTARCQPGDVRLRSGEPGLWCLRGFAACGSLSNAAVTQEAGAKTLLPSPRSSADDAHGSMPNEHYYLSLERNADVKAVPGMLIYAFRALLLFTNYEDFSRSSPTTRISAAICSRGSTRPSIIPTGRRYSYRASSSTVTTRTPRRRSPASSCSSSAARVLFPVDDYPLSSPTAVAWATASRREDTPSLR
jgi:hypothetical protein